MGASGGAMVSDPLAPDFLATLFPPANPVRPGTEIAMTKAKAAPQL